VRRRLSRGEQHAAPETGQFVRKALPFSTSDERPEARLKLFLHRYNLGRV
jgi:hypothetical protein